MNNVLVFKNPLGERSSKDSEDDPGRVPEIMYKLQIVWSNSPGIRLGQLLTNLMNFHHDLIGRKGTEFDLFYFKDTDLNSILDHEIQRIIDSKNLLEEEVLVDVTSQIMAYEELRNDRK